MLTIFTIPKPFKGHIGRIQRNAIANWCRLSPRPEIILFGESAGVAEEARRQRVRHETELSTNAYGTPLVSDAFARASCLSQNDRLMYSNADILYDGSLFDGIRGAASMSNFLISGRRWDVAVNADLSLERDETWYRLFADRQVSGRLHGPSGMDYFIFPRIQRFDMPDLAVGRVAWDCWMIWKCRATGIPVIDATGTIRALHQNHDYSDLALGCQHTKGPERDLNLKAAGGLSHLLTLREADWQMVEGRLKRPRWPQRLVAWLGPTLPYRKLLALKRILA